MSITSEVTTDAPPVAVAGVSPQLAPFCAPISVEDPCGPDLDRDSDPDYLNFLAYVEGMLPTSFFSVEDGRPFDPTSIDVDGQLAAMMPLLDRTRDIRLLAVRARLQIIKRDLAGFAVSIAAIAELLNTSWDAVHPRPENDDIDARIATLASLELPTVIFPLQYAPLIETRAGIITYRAWLIAIGEAKARETEATLAAGTMTDAVADAPSSVTEPLQRDLVLLSTSVASIQKAIQLHGHSAGLGNLATLASKMLAFISPNAPILPDAATNGAAADTAPSAPQLVGAAPASMEDAAQALAAIAQYYSRSEPSSPALPLVRQAHQLIGKSFLEVMQILMPGHVDKASFRIGNDPVFDLPVEKLADVSGVAPLVQSVEPGSVDADGAYGSPPPPRYSVETRPQAIALLDAVQRYFRHAEPSSPIPMLCDRARSLVERDFMGVLRDVLPKSALKNNDD